MTNNTPPTPASMGEPTDCRLEFEKWVNKLGFDTLSYGGKGYNSKITNRLWMGWRAAWHYKSRPATADGAVAEYIKCPDCGSICNPEQGDPLAIEQVQLDTKLNVSGEPDLVERIARRIATDIKSHTYTVEGEGRYRFTQLIREGDYSYMARNILSMVRADLEQTSKTLPSENISMSFFRPLSVAEIEELGIASEGFDPLRGLEEIIQKIISENATAKSKKIDVNCSELAALIVAASRSFIERIRQPYINTLNKRLGEQILARADLERQVADKDAQIAALTPYIQHLPDCKHKHGCAWEAQCTCGLEKLQKGEK